MTKVISRFTLVTLAAGLLLGGPLARADTAAADKAYAQHDWPTAVKEYLPLASSGNAEAQFRVGFSYCQGRSPNYTEAARWFRLAAQKGHANAQFNLGQLYNLGQGLARDPAEAVSWFTKAAEQGFGDAQLQLGLAYEEGNGIGRDPKEAARLYRLAATNPQPQQNRAIAEFSLAVLYHEGRGVSKDWKEAARWFELAAQRGYPEAQFNIGWMYYVPEGVEEDHVKAYVWMTLARNAAIKTESVVIDPENSIVNKSRKTTDELAKKMSPAQFSEAERMIKAWKPKNN